MATKRPRENEATPVLGASSNNYYKTYTTSFLNIYDTFVLGFSLSYAWKCPTRTYLKPFFRAHFSKNHLDIGVGSGYFPATTLAAANSITDAEDVVSSVGFHISQAQTDAPQRVTLWDMNSAALERTKRRVEGAAKNVLPVHTIQADAAEPIPAKVLDHGGKFDSISAFLLLHCIPRPLARKAEGLFSNARELLSPSGVFVGCTVLGNTKRKSTAPSIIIDWLPRPIRFGTEKEAEMVCGLNLFARVLMWLYALAGIFTNREDEPDGIVEALEREFEGVDSWIIGRVMLFRASNPRAVGE